MNKLRTSFELAQERIIPSKYTAKLEREEQIEKRRQQEEDLGYLPDFVDQKEVPNLEENTKNGILLGNETELFNEKVNDNDIDIDVDVDIEELAGIKETKEYIKQIQLNSQGDQADMELHWYGHFTSYSGFSRMNRAMVFGLSNRSMRIKVDMQSCANEINAATLKELLIMENNNIDPNAPKVFGATIPLNMMHPGRKILYTMMESASLHKDYVERLNLYDEVWVPTKYGEKLFLDNGVKVPVYHMPLGVDIERYTAYDKEAARESLGISLNRFVFLSVFKWGIRKGYDILLKAYLEEFSAKDEVSLLLVSRTDVCHDHKKIAQDFNDIRNTVKKSDEDLPHVSLYDKLIPERKMPEIYKAGDAFVLISRGEGCGLPYYEAAAAGLPIVGSLCSGQSDLLNENNSYTVVPNSYEKMDRLTKIGKTCRFYEDQLFPVFGKKEIEITKQHMRDIYENQEKAIEKANIMREDVEQYTWENAINIVHDRLLEIR